ncbi:MAG: guanylate kinase [Thermoleophilia bacterium]
MIVIAGPSGVGKGTLIGAVLPRLTDTVLARSATTRPRRGDEQQGREYYFLTADEFEDRVRQGEFIEHVQYGSHRYGTLASEVEGHLARGRNVLLEIEVEGARNVRRQMPEALLVFIAPPSLEVLGQRLAGRETETVAEIRIRMERAGAELAAQPEFDYIVVNQEVDQAADELEAVIKANLHGG